MDQVGFFVAVKRRAGGGQMELLGRFGWGEGRSSVLTAGAWAERRCSAPFLGERGDKY